MSDSFLLHNQIPATKLKSLGTSIFTEMTQLANRCGAINLSQGFPDFAGPDWVKEAACRAIRADFNQYAPSHGLPSLRAAIVDKVRRHYGLEYDPDFEVTVTSGATEAIHSTMLALLDPGDEVVTFEPFYDSYPACAAMNGASFRAVPLRAPLFRFDPDELRSAVTDRTRIILVNSPNNPTGRVFDREELEAIAEVARESGAFVVTDEVYEHIVFAGSRHVPIASLPGMRDLTITISSTAKTFSLTGWKIGYVLACPPLTAAVRLAHQFVTFSTATPLQEAMAVAIREGDSYYPLLASEYAARRDLLVGILQKAGFRVRPPEGAYFVLADFSDLGFEGDDVEFCRHLTTRAGVAAIPPSFFYQHPEEARSLVRFSFSKKIETIAAAGAKLEKLSEVLSR